MTSTPKGRARGRERAFVYYIIMSRPQPQYPLPQYLFLTFILSLAMDIEEIETLLRKPFYTEEDCDCQFVQYHSRITRHLNRHDIHYSISLQTPPYFLITP